MAVIEIIDALIICFSILVFCGIFTVAGLSGYFHPSAYRKKKKDGDRDGGWKEGSIHRSW